MTENPGVVYDEIPRFPPECLATLHNPTPAKFKQFRKGVDQLLQEGVIQVFHTRDAIQRVPILAAVGPLQFIPGTWRAWASDGNQDGRTDPQNLYDASLAAARKLCADAGFGGLRSDAQIARALKPYAVVDALVREKLARAREYEVMGIPAPDATMVVPGP